MTDTTTPIAHVLDAEGRRVPDLDATFGRRYRVVWSQARTGWPTADLPWLRQVACRHGHVYPYGPDKLAAVTSRPGIGRRLRALPCALTTRGEAESIITFDAARAAEVLALLKPYRRRQVSEAERARLAEMSRKTHAERRRGSLGEGSQPLESTITDGDA